MKGYIGNTDFEWYQFLLGQSNLEEANFWRPIGGRTFRAIRRGEPFFFKLKAKHNYAIVGFGLFTLFKPLTVLDAWQLFGQSNGTPSIEAMLERINRYTIRQAGFQATRAHTIGCILVATPIFFERSLWVDGPRDWSKEAVQGKTYDLTHGEGRRIWR